jgi:hypothetical protein
VGCRQGVGSVVSGCVEGSAPTLAATESSSGGVPEGRGAFRCLDFKIECSCQRPCACPAPRRACLGGSWDLSTTEHLRLPCSPPSLPRWKRGSVNYRVAAPALLPAELASVEAGICPVQSPCAAPHRACLGGSWDLSTTESPRLPCSPPSLPRWK